MKTPLRRGFFWLACLLAAPMAQALDGRHLAVVVNTADHLSVQIGEYYASRRHLSFQNVVRIGFPTGRTTLTRGEFEALKAAVDEQSVPSIEAYALTWAAPYKVECMSITSAFAFGFDPAFCAAGCQNTRRSPYFDSPTRRPHRHLGMRPTISIAATSFDEAKALIDRGVRADASFPGGTAYLLATSDRTRSARRAAFRRAERVMRDRIRVQRLQQDSLVGKRDVLFYFLGKERVADLDTLGFVPGAVADHLTSSGGQLTDSPQMSALRWLEAGATGSYGTVVEPCNLPGKFPDPAVLGAHYLAGETLIEAYWKSVAMPGQGIFIGEPLAAPFRRTRF